MVLTLRTARPTGPQRPGVTEAHIVVTRAGDGKKICEAIVFGRDVRWLIEPPAPVLNRWKLEMWDIGARAHNTFDAIEMINAASRREKPSSEDGGEADLIRLHQIAFPMPVDMTT